MHKMLGMGCRPSELLEIDDPYTAFCFDEACAVISHRISEGEEPKIKKEKLETVSKPVYHRPSEVYSKFNNINC